MIKTLSSFKQHLKLMRCSLLARSSMDAKSLDCKFMEVLSSAHWRVKDFLPNKLIKSRASSTLSIWNMTPYYDYSIMRSPWWWIIDGMQKSTISWGNFSNLTFVCWWNSLEKWVRIRIYQTFYEYLRMLCFPLSSGSLQKKDFRLRFVFKVHYLFSSAIHTCILIFFFFCTDRPQCIMNILV